MVLGIQEHLLLIEACTLWKCFNVILEACPKKCCQHIFFLVRPLFGQEYSRALSFCLWFTTLSPFAFKYGLAVFNEAEVAELERHHQHCSSRENFSSDKSLNQLPGFFVLLCFVLATMFWCIEATSLHPIHSLADKHILNMVSQGTCPTDHEGSWGWLQIPSTKNFKRRRKRQQ